MLKKVLPAIVIIGAIGFGAYTFWPKSSQSVPGELYRFYPESTEFFMEVAPGEKLSSRLYQVMHDKLGENASVKTPPGNVTSSKSDGESDKESKENAERLINEFEKTFKPYLSMGAWQSTVASKRFEPNTLVVLPLKEKLTFEDLNKRFDHKAGTFDTRTFNKHQYYVNQKNHAAIAIVDDLVLLTNRQPVMETSLELYDSPDKTTNVYEEKLNKTYLAKLPGNRQGTWLVHKSNKSEHGLAVLQKGAKQIPAPLLKHLEQLQSVNKLTVGTIEIQGDEWAKSSFISPLFLQDVEDENLRSQLKSIYSTNVALKSPKVLPEDVAMAVDLYGMNRLYHLYTDFAPAGEKQKLEGMAQFLKSVNIDFETDVLGMLSEEMTFAMVSGSKNMPLLLLGGGEKSKPMASLQKIANVLTSGFFPVKLDSHDEAGTTINTLAMKGAQAAMAPQVSFASLPKSNFVGVATTGVLMNVLGIADGKNKSLGASELYKELTKGFPATGNGLFYMNFDKLEESIGKHTDTPWKDTISAVAGMTAPGNDMLTGQVRVKFAPAKEAE